MSLTPNDLDQINRESIRAAGPRYTPSTDPHAPNLQIAPVVNAIEALSHSEVHRRRLTDLAAQLSEAWTSTPSEISSLFPSRISGAALCSTHLTRLSQEPPGSSSSTIKQIRGTLNAIQACIKPYEEKVYDQRVTGADTPEAREVQAQRIRDVQRFQNTISRLRSFVDSPSFLLVQNNCLLLKGGWGAGKTHTLCDVVRSRAASSFPTLFFLAQSLPRGENPLEAACKKSKLAKNFSELLGELNRLGVQSGTRTLLIVDGINEGDRVAWRRWMPAIVNRLRRVKNVALVLSCRTPFDDQIFAAETRSKFVEIVHNGFEDIEFNAQHEFFSYYQIPTPHIPLLAPEFSRPLFLKILCQSVASLSAGAKHKRISDFAAGQKTMTKLLEDFVVRIGQPIEAEFGLPPKGCWKLLKGFEIGSQTVGVSAWMADNACDYIPRAECLRIIRQIPGFPPERDEALLAKLVNEGLLAEDVDFGSQSPIEIVRLPYQRFSDHLICRHLLSKYLITKSEGTISGSFRPSQPLGKIFKPDRWNINYTMPGLASALILEFPERVKRVLPENKRELVIYLPKASLAQNLADIFIEGLLWRSVDSFCPQTDVIVSRLLQSTHAGVVERLLEALVCLGSRAGHPYDGKRLFDYLSTKKVVDRDMSWSEFLRTLSKESAVYRLMDWILSTSKEPIDKSTTRNLLFLCSTFLTSTVRPLRDRATKCLVVLGERHPDILFAFTRGALAFNDPYVPERILAASFGVLMRIWAYPPKPLKPAARTLATALRRKLQGTPRKAPIEHILMRDYASGFVTLTRRLCSAQKSPTPIADIQIKASRKSAIPRGDKISDQSVKAADSAIYMDFDNYTIGRLVAGRRNYDDSHTEYKKVRKQIRWRILNLGYAPEKFRTVDQYIGSANFNRSDNGNKIDRYGKKYSWIAFYEVAGRRQLDGILPDRDEIRISDCDIDPSFPDTPTTWRPPLLNAFEAPYRNPADWMARGGTPDYRHLLLREDVDGAPGPWTLLDGFINERSATDPREVFSFLRGLIIEPKQSRRLKLLLQETEYPGNHAIPESGEQYYLFGGEIGWSRKFGAWLRDKNGVARPQLGEALERLQERTVRKPVGKLTWIERLTLRRGLSADNGDDSAAAHVAADSRFVEVRVSRKLPGVRVEVPAWSDAWESYHSVENQVGYPSYPAPSLVDYLRLRKRGGMPDLFDQAGNLASIYRKFDDSKGFRSRLLYIRSDLLGRYLAHTRRQLVWINWGERSLEHNLLMNLRDSKVMHDVWDKHAHIHKKFFTRGNLAA